MSGPVLGCAGIALLALGCINVNAIPAPTSPPPALQLQWRKATSSSPRGRIGHALAALGDKTVLFGGAPFGPALADTWEWNGETWTELAPATNPPALANHAMATLGNKVVLFGGGQFAGDPLSEGPGVLSDETWEWDGVTWAKATPPSSPPARHQHAMATLGDKVVLFGGEGVNGPLDDTWEWDGTSWTQVALTSGPSARSRHAMATLVDRVVLFGGVLAPRDVPPDPDGFGSDTWVWDGSVWTMMAPPTAPEARAGHAMAVLGKDMILFGGAPLSLSASSPTAGPPLYSWRWDGATWTRLGPFCTPLCEVDGPLSRADFAMASRGGTILLFGGQTFIRPMDTSSAVGGGTSSLANDTWEWDAQRWQPRSASSPTYRFGDDRRGTGALGGLIGTRDVAMATLGDKVVLWGDAVGTWEWVGARWTARIPPISPPKRIYGHAMASLGDKVVLFGGWDLTYQEPPPETWEWDGTTWTRRNPETTAPPRAGHAMATLGNKVLLFGGADSDHQPTNDTWEWDGTTWTLRRPPASPPARYDHAMTTLGDKIVMFGGVSGGPLLNDTWEWDGQTWTRVASTTSPSARRLSAMTALNEGIVLFGGREEDTPLADKLDHDTWMFAAGRWTQLLPTAYPEGRGNHAMTTVAGQVLLVGGSDDRETWLLDASMR